MALREFEQVRERIALRVEVRTIVQAALAVLALMVAAFTAGYLLGRQAVPPTPAPLHHLDGTIFSSPLPARVSRLLSSTYFRMETLPAWLTFAVQM